LISALPLLTLLVVNPRKPIKLLKLDFTIIAVLQKLAFGYGIHALLLPRDQSSSPRNQIASY
jgi:hypothetical protein